jgi:DNA-directed RNA polymerase subunit RPC12/RpoP
MEGKVLGILACPACGRRKVVKPIKRGAKFRCGNCGSKVPLVLMRATGIDREGLSIEAAQRQTLAGLMRYAEHKGFKPGWWARKFKILFGSYPRGLTVESAPMTAELRLWVRKQGQVWAREKRKAQQTLFTDSPTVARQSPPTEVDQDGHIPGTLLTPDDLDVRL